MINEGVFRSPKWLRNFLDFEVNTGDDIKGEPSKRSIAREEKRQKEELLKNWDIAWEKAKDTEIFNRFLNFKLKKSPYNIFWSSDLRELKDKYRGDHTLFSEYKDFLEKEREEKRRKEEINNEIKQIINSIEIDFNKAPYRDKLTIQNGCIKYEFENGNTIDIFDIGERKFRYSTKDSSVTYTLSIISFSLLITTINSISKRMRNRPYSKSRGDYYGSDYNRTNKSKKRSSDPNPKRTKYDTLLNTIELRKKQLEKMGKDDEGRSALENELRAAEKMAKRMKEEYKFENLKSFKNYNRYD